MKSEREDITMQANEVVKGLMSDKKITQGEITKLLGMKSQSGVSQALSRDMKISMLIRFLDCMDCELIVRDKASGTEHTITD
jgi:hypothetical protein|nr:MAG TPA: octamer-binding transcription factor 1 [Caudoviricetes sp.]